MNVPKYTRAYIFCVTLLLLSALNCSAQGVFKFDIKGEIDPAMKRHVEKALEASKASKPELIIIEMDTYGGTLDDANLIRKKLLESKVPVWVWINKNAASAGALISIACDSIYMSEGASMGAATVVNGEDGSQAPDKYQSYMRSLMRATAEANHRNPRIAEAMVDTRVKLDTNLKKDDQVLTLTPSEAISVGYCEGVKANLSEVIAVSKLKNPNIGTYEPNATEKIIAFFMSPAVSGILLLIILGGIYFEMQAPGIGFPLFASITAGVLYLTPYYLTGLAENWEIGILLIGFVLLALEIFVIPGFGVAGVSGLICIVMALIMIMVNNDYFDFSNVSDQKLITATGITMFGLMGSAVLLFIGSKFIIQSKAFQKLSLTHTLESPNYQPEDVNLQDYSTLVGQEGEAYTVLRPSGKVLINDNIYDANSSGDYISAKEKIKVTGLNGGYLKVKKV
jgi:membrane-bound serine protease (ClpP class)